MTSVREATYMSMSDPRKLALVGLGLLLPALRGEAAATVYQVDPASSELRVHTGRAGLFAFAGHKHEVVASAFHGQVLVDFYDWTASSVTLVFESEELRVDPEKEPRDDLEEVQRTMKSARCLDVKAYPAAV